MRRSLFLSGVLWAFCAFQGNAQVTTGTISGVVRDTTGAVIPSVSLTLKNVDTGFARNVVTDEQGRYQAHNLQLGNYEVSAQQEGFQTEVRRGIVLTVGREAVVNFDLQVGTVTQTVEVTGEAPLVETTGSSVSGLVETAQIENLPLNGRSYDELAVLQPTVALSRFQTRQFQGGYTTKISIRGARADQNSFLLDGTDVMGPTNQIPGSAGGQSLGVDAVREFRVETGTFSAQYGRAAGGVINVITKSGTNEFHGTAFEFLRNDNLDAPKWEDNRAEQEKPEFKRNQFGFSLGGPIRKDEMFFFGNYEALRERLGSTEPGTVPTALARQGQVQIRGTDPPQFQQVTVNPVVVPYLNLYPLPNGRDFGDGTAEYLYAYSKPTNENFFMVRTDWNLSASDTFFARYTFDQGEVKSDQTFASVLDVDRNRNQYLTLEQTHIFSPRVLSTFRFGFNRSQTQLVPETPGFDDSLLEQLAFLPGHTLFKTGSAFSAGGGTTGMGTTNIPRVWAWNLFEPSGDITYTTGTHTLKAGVLYKRLQFNAESSLTAGGDWSFGSLPEFLRGTPASIRVKDPLSPAQAQGLRQRYLGWYIQDDIRWTPRLTFNLGFRHEFYTNPNEVAGRVCNLDRITDADFRCGNPVWPDYYSGYKNFGPKFGFAWDVWGDGKTSVRGGYGIFYDAMSPLSWYTVVSTQPPASRLLAPRNPPFPHPFDFLVTGAGASQPSPSPSGHTGTPNTMQYTLTIQRQLAGDIVLMVGYSGSVGRHLLFRAQQNTKVPTILADGRKCFNFDTDPVTPGIQPNPNCPNGSVALRNPNFGGRVNFHRTEANSNYNGMLLSVQKRMSRGIQFQLSYTLSKAHDIGPSLASSSRENASGTQGILDGYDWKLDRSLSDFDIRHNLSFNSTWDVPVGQGRLWGSNLGGVADGLLGGWQLSGLLKVSSSSPFTVHAGSRNWSQNGSAQPQERPDLVPGKSNNPILGSPDLWFDPAAFKPPELGFFGTLGRNTLSAPHGVTTDLSLLKNVGLSRVSEQMRLQFRAEFFNVFNHANFAIPALAVFDTQGQLVGSAGVISSTTGTSREIQLGLKLLW